MKLGKNLERRLAAAEERIARMQQENADLREQLQQARKPAAPVPATQPEPEALPDDLIPVPEAARLTKSHHTTIRRWVQNGLIRGWARRGLVNVTLVSKAEVQTQAGPVPIRPKRKPPELQAADQAQRDREVNAYLDSKGI